MPAIVGDETVGIKYAINGLLSLTPDGMPILGETPEVKGLWSAAAVWIKEGPGVGKSVAEWMTHGESEIDLHSSDIARFYEHQKTPCARQGAHGGELQQDLRDRPPVRAVGVEPRRPALAVHERERALGAVFFEIAGWERPHWYESNEPLLDEFGDRVRTARGRVGVALVVADHQRRAPRDARARGHVRPARRSRSSTSSGPARSTRPARSLRQMDVAGRARRLHAACSPRRRRPVRPHDHAARRRPLPCRDRRRARHGRPEVVRRPPARRRHARNSPTSPPRGRRSASGARARATSWRSLTSDDVSHDGVRLRHLPDDRDRPLRGARLADLVRRRARLGAVRPDRGGRAALGRRLEAGAAARARPVRHRRLRHDRAAREVLPRLRHRARKRVRRRRGRHGVAHRQGGGLRRQGCRTYATARRSPPRSSAR